jgi:hypothetical protein
VLIRPKFFEYCGEKEGRGKCCYKGFETPMDRLQKIIDDDIPDKKRTKTVDIIDIIPRPIFHKADNHQLSNIREHCERVSGYIDILRKRNISDEIKNAWVREAEDNVIQKLKNWEINDTTIRIILYKAFSEKYHDKKYSVMGRRLTRWLYQAHRETFEKVIEMSKG